MSHTGLTNLERDPVAAGIALAPSLGRPHGLESATERALQPGVHHCDLICLREIAWMPTDERADDSGQAAAFRVRPKLHRIGRPHESVLTGSGMAIRRRALNLPLFSQ